MGAVIRVDRAGACEIAEAAKGFDWTWTRANVDRFVAEVGWGEPKDSAEEMVWLESVTSVRVNEPRARVFGADGRVDAVVVTVADTADEVDELGPTLAAAFHEVSIGVWTRWEPPTEPRVLAAFGASWVFSNVVVGVGMGERSVELWLIAPAERQRVLATEQRAISDFISSAEWLVGATAISMLAQADPGDWSRSAMRRIVNAIGWKVDTEVEAEHGTLRSRAGVWTLRVGRSDSHDLRYGFGEFRGAELSLRIPEGEDTARIAYLTALDLCVRELGAPSLVGGPHAFATWRRGPITLTLSRRERWLGSAYLELALRPTEAVETEDYIYSEWDELWEPSYLWRVRPDYGADRSDIVGMYTPGVSLVRDWGAFDEQLDRVFGSLGADLPYIFRFATSVVWVITDTQQPGFLVQGWFAGDSCRVETYEGEAIVFRDFPPGRTSAKQIAAIVKAAVRSEVDSPERLRYYAFTPRAPQQLWDFRLGLPLDTREGP
ncbi:hypothetical protein IU501_18995 [Nocardia otitidiscaviarum]|uniref:DUF6301 family protein n=1 Tax=Nocardia otitidiscaviarum TaxID=1823 RepID=UPI001893F899|nr:DUF6301 family protein [Nocardia otitidiscaviarum]MBF6135082.1 hypothetical protein [Nocardia otitidiscaviarum]